MSDNPEAFDALRKVAYSFVNENGKDAVGLRHACQDFIRSWREARGSLGDSAKDDDALVDDVVKWTISRYNRPRYKPKRTREQRALAFLMTAEAHRMSQDSLGKASVRRTALAVELSKSTVARQLSRQGIAPRREAKIQKMAKVTQRLIRILDETFYRRTSGIIQLDRLSAALWDGVEVKRVPATTKASRLKKLKALLIEISTSGFDYSIVVVDDVCGVQRGRRFKSMSEAVTWIAETQRLNRYAPINLPTAAPLERVQYFWDDPAVKDVISIIDMSFTGHFYPFEKLDAIFRFERILIDMTPVIPWLERAQHSFGSDHIGDNLANLAGKITDAGVRRATSRLAKILTDLRGHMGEFPLCYDAFQTVDQVVGVMDKVAEQAPESYARLAYIRDWFEHTADYYMDFRDTLSNMLEYEKSGEWQAPDAETLSYYFPEPTADPKEHEND